MTALDNYINSLKINSGTLKCLRVYSSRNKFASHSIQSSREKSLKEVAKMKDFHRQREEGTSTVCEAEGKSWLATADLLSFRGWLEKDIAPHSSPLAWGIPWTEEPGRLQSVGPQRVGHD